MAHAGTTLDLGRSQQRTKAGRPGWFRVSAMVILAIMLGFALGAGAWTLAHTQAAVSVSDNAARIAAIHERIEANQALRLAQVDRSTDAIESHRTAVANLAISPRDERLEMINTFETIKTAATPRDDRLEAVTQFERITGFAGVVRPYPVYDPVDSYNRAYGLGVYAPAYPVYDPVDSYNRAYGLGVYAPAYPVYDPQLEHDRAYGIGAFAVTDPLAKYPLVSSAPASGGYDVIEKFRTDAANAAMAAAGAKGAANMVSSGMFDQVQAGRIQTATAGSTVDNIGADRRGYHDLVPYDAIVGRPATTGLPDDIGSFPRGYSQAPADPIVALPAPFGLPDNIGSFPRGYAQAPVSGQVDRFVALGLPQVDNVLSVAMAVGPTRDPIGRIGRASSQGVVVVGAPVVDSAGRIGIAGTQGVVLAPAPSTDKHGQVGIATTQGIVLQTGPVRATYSLESGPTIAKPDL